MPPQLSTEIERPKTLTLNRRDLYCYTNDTKQIQIIRIARVSDNFLERTVLPNCQILFAATADAELEVYTYDVATAILTERITCDRLITRQPLNASR